MAKIKAVYIQDYLGATKKWNEEKEFSIEDKNISSAILPDKSTSKWLGRKRVVLYSDWKNRVLEEIYDALGHKTGDYAVGEGNIKDACELIALL